MTKQDWLVVTIGWLIVCGVGFTVGVLMAYYTDVLASKTPDVWVKERTELSQVIEDNNLPIKGVLQVEPNYGYQTPQEFDEQPAEGWQTLSTIEEL